jgi:hypothetical protein
MCTYIVQKAGIEPMNKPKTTDEQIITKQIILQRQMIETGKRTIQVKILVSPEERKLIDQKFGGPSGMRDFALGITDKQIMDLYIALFQKSIEIFVEESNKKND